jgi:chemotaxis protein MotB
MSRNKKNSDSGSRSDGWMVTFATLCTLLLMFFVLLLSMSSLNSRAIQSSFHNFERAGGILMFKTHEKVTAQRDMVIEDISKSLESLHLMDVRDLDEVIQGPPSQKEIRLPDSFGNAIFYKKRFGTENFSFIFGDDLLFESGSAQLKPDAYPMLRRMAKFMIETPYHVYIDGHTDNVPVRGLRYASNDELSLARARAVMDYLIGECLVPEEKLALGAYGSTLPMAGNETPEGRKLNRRVELIFHKPS